MPAPAFLAHGFLYDGDLGGSPVWVRPAGPNALFCICRSYSHRGHGCGPVVPQPHNGTEPVIHPQLPPIYPSLLRTVSPFPPLLFVIFGMWASKAAAPGSFPRARRHYLNGQAASYIAEISASPEYYPDKIRIPLRLLRAITGDRQTPLDGGVLLSLPRKDPANPGAFSAAAAGSGEPGGRSHRPFFSPAIVCSFGPLSSASEASEIRAASITCVIRPEKASTPSAF